MGSLGGDGTGISPIQAWAGFKHRPGQAWVRTSAGSDVGRVGCGPGRVWAGSGVGRVWAGSDMGRVGRVRVRALSGCKA
ncbi:hypothetical protein ATK30_4202 [Amycolatopsis echigonensis]|uniref:Uncharacterized protein n=1 Tax=Amycolatopsis echigonensis TaxID=2576905 RepID=A0A2N3WHL4_9PSEU|nr:hypothetical protein ATK30_4202 [Amycolatopsis niigatensis]